MKKVRKHVRGGRGGARTQRGRGAPTRSNPTHFSTRLGVVPLGPVMADTTFFQKFDDLNVLILGDVMVDRYVGGSVTRISPEAPVPVLHWSQTDDRLGGAANVALNVAAMGATPLLFSVVGRDADGKRFCQLLSDAHLNTRGIVESPERPTTLKTRFLAGSQQLLRLDRETVRPLSQREEDSVLHHLRVLLDQTDVHAILLQDYNKGVLTERMIREILLIALRHDIPVSVDPKKDNFWRYQRVQLFKPNLKEIRESLDPSLAPNLDALRGAAREINHRLDNALTLITLSERGVFMDDRTGGTIYPTHPRNIADVCGAGDTVISVATLALAAGLDAGTIAQLSNLAGGQVCEFPGVVPVNRSQLEREFAEMGVGV